MRTALLLGSLLGVALGPASPTSVTAQATPAPEAVYGDDATLVDRVVAVVGDSAILLSQLSEDLVLARARNLEVTPQALLDNLINMELIRQEAARDSTLVPTADDVERRVTQQVEQARSQFPSPQAFDEALTTQGLTMETYRAQVATRVRADLLRRRYLERQLQSAPVVAVTEEEMRQAFEESSGQLGQRPELVTIRQVLVPSGASDSAWTSAEARIDSLRAEIVLGASFDSLARAYSQDPGSAAEGGLLGWIQRGQTVPAFERAAFALPDGGLSRGVRTEYGIHLLRVERSRPGAKRVRHILIRPVVEERDRSATLEFVRGLAERIRAGEDARALAREYGDPELPREFEFPRNEPGSLPPGFVENLAGAQEGDVIGPFETQVGQRDLVAVLQVVRIREAGAYTFEDLREQVRDMLLQQKREQRVYERLRERAYIDVRPVPELGILGSTGGANPAGDL